MDFSALLAAKPVDIPDPLTTAGRGLSLADLLQKTQAQGLDLQTKQQLAAAYSDPNFLASMNAYFGGGPGAGAGGGVPGAAPGAAPGGAPGFDFSSLSDKPLAAQSILSNMLAMRDKAASAAKDFAAAGQSTQTTLDAKQKMVGGMAGDYVANGNMQSYYKAAINAHALGLDGVLGPAPDPSQDPDGAKRWAASASGSLLDDATRATIQKTQAETGAIPATTAAKTAEAAAASQNAATAQSKADLEALKYNAGEKILVDGKLYVVQPRTMADGSVRMGAVPAADQTNSTASVAPPVPNAPAIAPAGSIGTVGNNQPGATPGAGVFVNTKNLTAADAGNLRRAIAGDVSTGAVNPPTGPTGAPLPTVAGAGGPTVPAPGAAMPTAAPKLGESPADTRNEATSQAEMTNLIAKAQAAAPMKALVQDLRTKESQGIMSGALVGQPLFQKIAAIGQQLGSLTPDQANILANSQAWDATAGQLVAQAVSQFAGSRIAAKEVDFFKGVKPSQTQTPEGRAQLYQELYSASDRVQQQADQAAKYMKDNPGAGLGSFQPTFKPATLPPIKFDTLPNPSTWASNNGGKALVDDNGVYHVVSGGRWTIVPGPNATGGVPSSMVSQVPQ